MIRLEQTQQNWPEQMKLKYTKKKFISPVNYKTDYDLGEELDLTGMEIHVAMSDGTYKEVAPADARSKDTIKTNVASRSKSYLWSCI